MEYALAITYTNYAYPLQAVVIKIYVKWTERKWQVPDTIYIDVATSILVFAWTV
jgi:hypothetical protein